MGNPADTLVKKYPDRVGQLYGPVYKYLSQWAPFKGTDQDLYMAIFYPIARGWSPAKALPADVQAMNPGIKTARDYIRLVNSQKDYHTLKAPEWTALKDVAGKLGLSVDSLYKQINFESGWDPLAKNPNSGARGLIQFMPHTAKGMGFKGSIDIGIFILAAGVIYLVKRIIK